jgi:hypothetical protein
VAGDLIVVGASAGARMKSDPTAIAKSNCCLRLLEKDGRPTYEVCWTAAKATASYATPLAHRGYVYFVNSVGVVYCLEQATGKPVYTERIEGECWASPLGAGDHVYFFGKDGRTTVLRAGPKFEKIAVNRLWSPEELPAATDAPADSARRKEPTQSGPSKKGSSAQKPPPDRGAEGAGSYLDPIVYGVAAVDGALFVRTGTTLYRIGKP